MSNQPERIHFVKFQGVGNDFVMIDNRDGKFDTLSEDRAFTSWVCDRRYGVGADGILELRTRPGYDFEMVYTQEDGVKTPELCGNGSRCIVAFAHSLKDPHQGDKYNFWARDGPHIGWVDEVTSQVHVKFRDMDNVTRYDADNFHIHVGNELHVTFVKDLWEIDVIQMGRELGYHERYMDERQGCNVMFVQVETDGNLSARYFEAKIDYEPFACGTGAVGSALVNEFRKPWQGPKKNIQTGVMYKGGKVEILFDQPEPTKFENVYLIGPALQSYEGYIRYDDYLALPKYKYNYNK